MTRLAVIFKVMLLASVVAIMVWGCAAVSDPQGALGIGNDPVRIESGGDVNTGTQAVGGRDAMSITGGQGDTVSSWLGWIVLGAAWLSTYPIMRAVRLALQKARRP